MTSLLTKCPQCGVTYAKESSICPECSWSDRGDAGVQEDQATTAAFSERLKIHRRNYAAYMVLMFATGLIGLLTSYLWLRTIFMGDVIAFFLIIILTVVSGVLAVLTFCSENFLPTNLNCPTCEFELDNLGFEGDRCPGCNSLLR